MADEFWQQASDSALQVRNIMKMYFLQINNLSKYLVVELGVLALSLQ